MSTQKEDFLDMTTLVDYAFSKLPPEHEQEVESFLEQHPDYATIVDSLLEYCLEHELKSPAAFFEHFEKEKHSFFINSAPLPIEPKIANPSVRWFWMGLAASFLLLVSYLAYLFWPVAVDVQQLALQVLQANQPKLLNRTLGNDGPETLDTFLVFARDIQNQNLAQLPEAIQFLEALPETHELKGPSRYLLGHAHLLQKDYEAAIKAFQDFQASQPGSRQLREAADFYLLLAYMLNGNKDQYQDQIKRILDTDNHQYRRQVEKLKKSLE